MGIRATVTLVSFVSTVLWLGFFWFAPFFGFPLDWTTNEPQRFIEILIPIFFGFLVSASTYAVNPVDIVLPSGERYALLRIIIYGGIFTFYVLMTMLCVAFHMGHQEKAASSYLTLDQFSSGVAIASSILTGVVSIAIAFIFGVSSAELRDISPVEAKENRSDGTI